MDESKLNFGPEGESSDSSNITSEHWQVFMDEADNFRQIQAEKKAKLDGEFETFLDHSQFPKRPSPNCCTRMSQWNRVEMIHQMREMLQSENEAVF